MARRRAAAVVVALTCVSALLLLFGSTGASSTCPASTYGDGADGPFIGGDPNAIRTALTSTATAGQAVVAVADSSGFTVGSEVFIHQVTGAAHGSYEFGCIAYRDVGSITLTAPLARTYNQDSVARTQVLRVPHFASVSGPITTIEWNGSVGGIVVFRALSIDSANIDVSSRGQKGGYGNDDALHAGLCSWPSGQGQAQQGHSQTGVVACAKASNGGGGGGGGQPSFVESCEFGSGGGGGYGTAGGNGGGCAAGVGGAPYGTVNLSTIGPGSGGGGATWGTYPYGGGRRSGDERWNDASGQGGGSALIFSASITSTTVSANGNFGGRSSNGYAGGGGSGGAIKIVANEVSATTLQALGGAGGSGGIASGGVGGAGRIRVEYCGTFAGSSSPQASLQQLNCNDAPSAHPDTHNVQEDATLTVTPPGVLANDSDPNGDALTAVFVSGPASGTVVLNANGSFTYTPNAHFYGTDSFGYRARDGAGAESAPAIVTITVSAVNDAPRFDSIGDQTVDEDAGTRTVTITGVSPGPVNEGAQTVNLTATSSDPAVVSNPTISGSGATLTLSYQAASNANGVVVITVTAQDDGGIANGGQNSSSRTFTLTVNAVNDRPGFDPIADQSVNEDAGTRSLTISGVSPGPLNEGSQTVSFAAASSDPSIVPNPTISGTGATRTLSYQPAPNANGNVIITVFGQDSGGTALGGQDSFSRTFAITVIPVPDADLSLSKGVSPSAVLVGESVTYTIIIANAGPDAAENVQVTDSVPAGVAVTSVTTTQGACSGTGPVACAVGTLATGASATVTIAVTTTATGSLTNTASATTTTADPSLANNSASATLLVSPPGHDVGIAPRGFALSPKYDLSRSGPIETIRIKVRNYGRNTSEAISYSVTSSAGDTLSPGCFGTTPQLAPSATYTVVGCTITYAGTGPRTVTLTTAHDDRDAAIDEDLTNNVDSVSVSVRP